jgi:hypothetical protein
MAHSSWDVPQLQITEEHTPNTTTHDRSEFIVTLLVAQQRACLSRFLWFNQSCIGQIRHSILETCMNRQTGYVLVGVRPNATSSYVGVLVIYNMAIVRNSEVIFSVSFPPTPPRTCLSVPSCSVIASR